MSTLERAIEIAVQAHSGHVDKAGLPYVLHPLRVMRGLSEANDRIVAVLHDVVEDSEWTIEGLRAEGFDEAVLAAVDALTWRERDGETYEAFVQRASINPIARRVKLADIDDNLDLSRIKNPTPRDHARFERYQTAREVLSTPGKGPQDGYTANTNHHAEESILPGPPKQPESSDPRAFDPRVPTGSASLDLAMQGKPNPEWLKELAEAENAGYTSEPDPPRMTSP